MSDFTQTIPVSLYIHLPWCVRKCPYCDFNSHPLHQELPEEEYVHALLKDLENDLPKLDHREIESIFFGGGTPSLFSPQKIGDLLDQIQLKLRLKPKLEITLEANPGTVEQQKFKQFRAAGINRLSLGIQSFANQHLTKLGRIHDSAEAKRAIEAAQKAGFDNFNLDLMYGLPDQTLEQAISDLETAIQFYPTHLSWYQLTIEPNTAFYFSKPKLPEHDRIWQFQETGQEFLKTNGYDQYEISAYSQPNKQCQHNLNYWRFGDYLGIGAGAHSKITNLKTKSIRRAWKIKHPKFYLKATNFSAEEKIISSQELPLEFFMNAFRLSEKIPLLLFEQRTGLKTEDIAQQLNLAQEKEFIVMDKDEIMLTTLGTRFVNELLELFLNG